LWSVWQTAKLHLSSIGNIAPAEKLDERRFAGAVFANECMNLARRQGNIDRIESDHARKALREPFYLKKRRSESTAAV
jgi:hypothetical protein